MVTSASTTIQCRDGYPLAGTLYQPVVPLKGAVMIAPATGIKRKFYDHFATFLAEQGFGVITFDNRGIADSVEGNLKDSKADLVQWGQEDLPAILRHLQDVFPDVNYHLIGHSAGGQLIGLMDNCHELSSMYAFACSSGQLSNMALGYKIKAHFFMNALLPVTRWIYGYSQSQWVGMGEPLPYGVSRQWQQWCNRDGYVKAAFGKEINEHHYDSLAIPACWANASDDDIAIDINVEDMLSVFKNLQVTRKRFVPSEIGVKEIGHMKFFRPECKVLWSDALAWFTQHSITGPQRVNTVSLT